MTEITLIKNKRRKHKLKEKLIQSTVNQLSLLLQKPSTVKLH